MWSGIRQIGKTLRTERKLVCPWKPRPTWYGQIVAGVGVATCVVGGLAAVGYGSHELGNWISHRRAEKWRLDQERRLSMRLNDPEAYKQMELDEKLLQQPRQKASERPGFDDHSFCDWHDTPHWPSSIFWGLSALAILRASQLPFRVAKVANTLCEQGGWMTFAYTMILGGSALTLRSGDNAFAAICKYQVKDSPNLASEARIRHQTSILRQSKILSIPLAAYKS